MNIYNTFKKSYLIVLFFFIFLIPSSFSSLCTSLTSDYSTEAFDINKISINNFDVYQINELTLDDTTENIIIDFTLTANLDADNSYFTFLIRDLGDDIYSVSSETLDYVQDSTYIRSVSIGVNLNSVDQENFTLEMLSSSELDGCFEKNFTINIRETQNVADENFDTNKILVKDITLNNQDLYYNDNAILDENTENVEILIDFLAKEDVNDTEFTAILEDFDDNIVARSDQTSITQNTDYTANITFDINLKSFREDSFKLRLISSNTLEEEFEKTYTIYVEDTEKVYSEEYEADKFIIKDITLNDQDLYYNDNAILEENTENVEILIDFLAKESVSNTEFTAILEDFDDNIVARSNRQSITSSNNYTANITFEIDLKSFREDSFKLRLISSNTLEDEFEKTYTIYVEDTEKAHLEEYDADKFMIKDITLNDQDLYYNDNAILEENTENVEILIDFLAKESVSNTEFTAILEDFDDNIVARSDQTSITQNTDYTANITFDINLKSFREDSFKLRLISSNTLEDEFEKTYTIYVEDTEKVYSEEYDADKFIIRDISLNNQDLYYNDNAILDESTENVEILIDFLAKESVSNTEFTAILEDFDDNIVAKSIQQDISENQNYETNITFDINLKSFEEDSFKLRLISSNTLEDEFEKTYTIYIGDTEKVYSEEYDADKFMIKDITLNNQDLYYNDNGVLDENIENIEILIDFLAKENVDNTEFTAILEDFDDNIVAKSTQQNITQNSNYQTNITFDINLKSFEGGNFKLKLFSSNTLEGEFEKTYTIYVEDVEKVYLEEYETDKFIIKDMSLNQQDLYYNNNVRVTRGVSSFDFSLDIIAKEDINNGEFTILVNDFDENIVSKSSVFSLEKGEEINIPLSFEIDLLETKKDKFTLKLLSSNSLEKEFEKDFEIKILEIDKDVQINEIYISPTNLVEKGDFVELVIEVENIGLTNEEGVLISIVSNDLLLKERVIIDEIEIGEIVEKEIEFQVPSQITSKTYDIDAIVYFDNGRENVDESLEIRVLESSQTNIENTLSFNFQNNLNAFIGEKSSFFIEVINQDSDEKVLSISSQSDWADISTTPSVLIVPPTSKKKIKVNVVPKQSSEIGNNFLDIQVKEGSRIESELSVLVNVGYNVDEQIEKSQNLNLFLIGFIVFGIILLLMILFFKMKDKKYDISSRIDENEILDAYNKDAKEFSRNNNYNSVEPVNNFSNNSNSSNGNNNNNNSFQENEVEHHRENRHNKKKSHKNKPSKDYY